MMPTNPITEETAAHDKAAVDRLASAEADASAAAAFSIASDLENDLSGIEYLVDALHMIGEAATDGCVSSALYGVAAALDDHLKRAQEKQGEIFHRLWSYAYGKRREMSREEKLDAAFLEAARQGKWANAPDTRDEARAMSKAVLGKQLGEPVTDEELSEMAGRLLPALERAVAAAPSA